MSKWISDTYIKVMMKSNRMMQGNAEYELWTQAVDKCVDAMPSIEIIHCMECKHWTNGDDTYGICYRCPNTRQMRCDDFCSRGEREESR